MIEEVVNGINKYGFPIIAACGMGYFVYFVWKWATEEVDPMLGSARTTLIALVDRIRMLDNDMIRLNTKLSMVLELHPDLKDNRKSDAEMAKFVNTSQQFDQSKVSYQKPTIEKKEKD